MASIAALAFLAGCLWILIELSFSYKDFAARYERGGTRKLFSALTYATNGWLGIALFGPFAAFAAALFGVFATRTLTSRPAVEIVGNSVVTHSTFLRVPHEILFSKINSVELTTEGEAASRSARTASAFVPLGAGWLQTQAEKKVCLVINFVGGRGRDSRLKLSAQHIEGGKWSLADFGNSLREAMNAREANPGYDGREVWKPRGTSA